jgi:hypothetical protein
MEESHAKPAPPDRQQFRVEAEPAHPHYDYGLGYLTRGRTEEEEELLQVQTRQPHDTRLTNQSSYAGPHRSGPEGYVSTRTPRPSILDQEPFDLRQVRTRNLSSQHDLNCILRPPAYYNARPAG